VSDSEKVILQSLALGLHSTSMVRPSLFVLRGLNGRLVSRASPPLLLQVITPRPNLPPTAPFTLPPYPLSSPGQINLPWDSKHPPTRLRFVNLEIRLPLPCPLWAAARFVVPLHCPCRRLQGGLVVARRAGTEAAGGSGKEYTLRWILRRGCGPNRDCKACNVATAGPGHRPVAPWSSGAWPSPEDRAFDLWEGPVATKEEVQCRLGPSFDAVWDRPRVDGVML
jgi:hypothetical protein